MIFMKKNMHNLSKSNIVAEIPLACSDETAAVEFFEFQRWGDTPFLLFVVCFLISWARLEIDVIRSPSDYQRHILV